MSQLFLSRTLDNYASQSWHIFENLRDWDPWVSFPGMINSWSLKNYIIILSKDAGIRLRYLGIVSRTISEGLHVLLTTPEGLLVSD